MTILELENQHLREDRARLSEEIAGLCEEVARLETELAQARAETSQDPQRGARWIDVGEARTIYKDFMKRYHPDHNPNTVGFAQGVNAFWDALERVVHPRPA